MIPAPQLQALPRAEATIVIPVFNEGDRLQTVVDRCRRAMETLPLSAQICVLNDGSTDWSEHRERLLQQHGDVHVMHRTQNGGKGAVLADLFPHLQSRYVVVIDADGEYAPEEIERLLLPLHRGEADWVMGSRFGFDRPRPRQYRSTYLANRFFSRWFQWLSGVSLRDPLTGLYAFRTETIESLELRESRFAYTAELLWHAQRVARARWHEVPISYNFRTYAEGKKIRWWEGWTLTRAFWRYRRD